MTTILIICAILSLPAFVGAIIGRRQGFQMGGIVGLAIAFAFFSIGHFVRTDGMIDMLPDVVPLRSELI